MNERQSLNLFNGRVDRQVGTMQRVSPLALVGVAIILVVFGISDVTASGVAVAELSSGRFLPFEPYDAVGIEAAEPMAGVFLPFEPYANLEAKAAGIEGAEFAAGVFLPFERDSAFEQCC